jgi:hypothetical protein
MLAKHLPKKIPWYCLKTLKILCFQTPPYLQTWNTIFSGWKILDVHTLIKDDTDDYLLQLLCGRKSKTKLIG